MAAAAHLTWVAPDNEKFTVPIGAKQIAQAQSLLTSPRLAGSKALSCRQAWQQRRKRLAHSPGGGAGGRGGRGGGGGLGLGLGDSAALTANWCIATSRLIIQPHPQIRACAFEVN